jgi:Kef-type K+ transport system membrane component KefB
MKKIFEKLSWIAGTLLNVVTVVFAVIYLWGVVVWMHAPTVPALLLTLAMTLPFFGLAWVLRRLGQSSYQRLRPQPWYPPQSKE